ncbi:MAG: hypothetical protein ACRDJC_01775 [Thermomicrobiales bacterium]
MPKRVVSEAIREAPQSARLDEDRFWRAAASLLAQEGVTRSTMMGFPCLRVDGRFLASYDRATGDLLVKLPADRVDQLLANGQGHAFSPAGRRFREWVALPPAAESDWGNYLDEALRFVAGSG